MKYLDYILEREKQMADFPWMITAEDGDVDLTILTLQSLEPYRDEEDAKVIDKGCGISGGYTGR